MPGDWDVENELVARPGFELYYGSWCPPTRASIAARRRIDLRGAGTGSGTNVEISQPAKPMPTPITMAFPSLALMPLHMVNKLNATSPNPTTSMTLRVHGLSQPSMKSRPVLFPIRDYRLSPWTA